uniref:Uncharacterized protein n=1 Tax=uncultured marine virus TaxID=186617 RepID=A0A0F7L3L0_9VIRU|nr:hypothetical protein [uncultured marine virus]
MRWVQRGCTDIRGGWPACRAWIAAMPSQSDPSYFRGVQILRSGSGNWNDHSRRLVSMPLALAMASLSRSLLLRPCPPE